MTTPDAGFTAEDRKRVARGVALTLLGKVAEAAGALHFFIARHLFGGVAFGLFIIAYNLVELLARFLVGGFGDAIVYFGAARSAPATNEDAAAKAEREEALYRALATCFAVPLALSLVAMLVLHLVTPLLYDSVWREHDRRLLDCIRILSLALPLAVLSRLPAEAAKAKLDMKWVVIAIDGLLPLSNLTLAVVFWLLGLDARGLAWAAVLAHAICIPVSWYGYTRHFSLARLLRALSLRRQDRVVLGFALPQSVNMMFGFGLSRVDTLMLSGWVNANLVGVFALMSEMARTIRAARTSFSTVFAPLVAKYKAQGNREGLIESLHAISRWTSALSIPFVIVIMAFYPEIILGPGVPWTHGAWFPWLTVLAPILSCFLGLAGNLLLMTGHSRLLLLNSGIMMGVNVVLNALFIPIWGLVGAAFATMLASLVMTVLQTAQMGRLEHVHFAYRQFVPVLIAAAVTLGPVAWMNTPAGVDFLYGGSIGQAIALKVAITVGALALYTTILLLWPGGHSEWLRARLRRRSAGGAPLDGG